MEAMTVKQFDRLGRRDFENGSVLDEIRVALEEREQLLSPQGDTCEESVKPLFAAAPDLLEACKLAIEGSQMGVSPVRKEFIRRAIAKAEPKGRET